jgi:hypothetical protein
MGESAAVGGQSAPYNHVLVLSTAPLDEQISEPGGIDAEAPVRVVAVKS